MHLLHGLGKRFTVASMYAKEMRERLLAEW
jgi:hypothetical protein